MKKTMCMILIASLSLMGCDPGKKSINKLMETYGEALKDGVNENNVEQANALATGLKLVSKSYADKSSGKIAQEKLTELRAKVTTRREALVKALEIETQAMSKVMTPVEAKFINLMKEIKGKKADFSSSEKLKKDQCYAGRVGGEFDKDRPFDFLRINIIKIVEVGENEVLVEDLHKADANDLYTVIKDEEKKQEPHAQPKFYFDDDVKIDCARAEELANAYQQARVQSQPMAKTIVQIKTLNSILSDNLF